MQDHPVRHQCKARDRSDDFGMIELPINQVWISLHDEFGGLITMLPFGLDNCDRPGCFYGAKSDGLFRELGKVNTWMLIHRWNEKSKKRQK